MHTGSLNCRFRWQPDTHAPSALGATARKHCRKPLGGCPHALTAPRKQPASKKQTPAPTPTVLTSFSDVDEMPSTPEMPSPSTLATQGRSSTVMQPLDPPRSTGIALNLLFAMPMQISPATCKVFRNSCCLLDSCHQHGPACPERVYGLPRDEGDSHICTASIASHEVWLCPFRVSCDGYVQVECIPVRVPALALCLQKVLFRACCKLC